MRKLTSEILTVQAEGSYDKANAMLDKYADPAANAGDPG